MNNLVVLSLGNGDLSNGFPSVTAQLWEPSNPNPMKFTGSLPKAAEISELYKYWQLLYSALYQRLALSRGIEIIAGDVTNVSVVEFSDLCQQLSNQINAWLSSEPFRHIDQQLRTHLEPEEEIRFIIETNDNLLRRIPWHLWNFFEHYPKAEVALSALEYQRAKKILRQPSKGKARILAILGDGKGIDIEKDHASLTQLPNSVETKFLLEPRLEDLHDQLWKDWDILFFAGHSSSQEKGILQLNQTYSITLDQLRYALKKAIGRGLKLAIFNSCDGLGLAQALFDLHIPQVIVMREPVPDVVAQEFLRHFLVAFSGGQSLYASVREARERLQQLEGKYPCATWLPVICQNLAEVPTTWQECCGKVKRNSGRGIAAQPNRQILPNARQLPTMLLLSVVVTGLVMGVRYLGILQNWELQAFDQILRLRPEEKPDPRLLVVTITEADIKAQNPEQRQGSLSDIALWQLLQKLEQFKPRVIGLDIYRDFPAKQNYPGLATNLHHSDRLIAVCKVSDSKMGEPGVAPPPEIQTTERLGFSDFVVDPDSIVRRQLLTMSPEPASPCTTPYAFNVQLAFRYLAAEKGISPNKYTPDGLLQLGDAIFKPLEAHTGGYQGVDALGYQVLLNYRSKNVAEQVTLTQVLTDKNINPSLFKNRIILIGTTANSFQDSWLTPYSNEQGYDQQLSGVLVQAQMVSQILSAVLDHRPLLWVLPLWGEVLWVWGWSLIGGMVAWRFYSPLHWGLAIATGEVFLTGLCFGILVQSSCWMPLVPAALTLVATSSSVAVYAKSN